MKIISLKAENVKRLQAVEITPDGALIVIGGKNGAGKSSVLDAIEYAIGGKGSHCRQPVRDGEDKATIVCDLGEIIVKRTITKEGGGSLIVQNKDGARPTSPQKVLDGLTGALSFDPLKFKSQRPNEQAETLRGLVGLDFTEQDKECEAAFSARTTVNRDGKAMAARHDAMPVYPDAPDKEESSAAVLTELEKATKKNTDAEQLSADAQRAIDEHKRASDAVQVAKAALGDAQREEDKTLAVMERAEKADYESSLTDLEPLRARLSGLEDSNAKVRANVAQASLGKELVAKRAESGALSKQLAEIDKAKAAAIAAAEYPVDGLGFDNEGLLTLAGVPFDQASSAEQLRVSVAMGLALNPTLRVLLVRDGSLLDEDSLRMVAEMAEKADAQVWIERVEDDEHVGVLIEDGRVKERVTV